MIDRHTQAAVLCRAYAAEPHVRARQCLAQALLSMPFSPLRQPRDRALEMARDVLAGRATPDGLRAFAGDVEDEAGAEALARWQRAAMGGRV